MGSTAGLMKKFNNAEELEKQLLKEGNGKFSKESLGLQNEDGEYLSGGDLASWVSSKQAGHMSGMHALALEGSDGKAYSVGLSMTDDGARVTGVDSSFKEDSSRSKNDSNSIKTGDYVETGGDVNSAITAYKATHKGQEPTTGELVDYIKNSQMVESSKNHLIGNIAASVADASGQSVETVETALLAGGSGLAALGLNSTLGKPINKVLGLGKKLSPFNSVGKEETPKKSDNHSDTQDG